MTVSNCTLSSNYAMFRGGAIYNNHLLTVTHSVITNNHAGLGGGIHNGGGTVTLTDSTLMKNYADMVPKRGGGVYNDRGTLTVINSTITGNEATLGAGINHSLGALTVTRSTFSYNVSDTDAGGLMTAGVATVTNSTFYGNLAGELFFDGEGGGILHAGGTLTVNNVTFHRNTAYDTEAGGGASIAVDDGEVTLRNAILASNGSCLLTGGSLEADAHNLAVDGSCGKATVKNLTDLALSDLASNGGPTQTVALGAKSAAIDAGDDSVCAAPPVNSLDQRGVTRPQGAHCDVGAFERAAP
ncbi:MAG: choice-of-anchor Q domain-containing protein [Gammaproteobacteria bacterium]